MKKASVSGPGVPKTQKKTDVFYGQPLSVALPLILRIYYCFILVDETTSTLLFSSFLHNFHQITFYCEIYRIDRTVVARNRDASPHAKQKEFKTLVCCGLGINTMHKLLGVVHTKNKKLKKKNSE